MHEIDTGTKTIQMTIYDNNHRFRQSFLVYVVILCKISVRLRNPLLSYLGICPVYGNVASRPRDHHGSLGNSCLDAYHGPIICKNRQYDIHITAQIYFLHIGSHQKANIFSYVVVQCKDGCQVIAWSGMASRLLGSTIYTVTYLLQALHPTLSINNFILAFPILLWYMLSYDMLYVRAVVLYKDNLLSSPVLDESKIHTSGGGAVKNGCHV